MNRHDQTWARLTAAARRAPDSAPEAAPYGFATRVASLGLEAPQAGAFALLEKFALRGFLAAAALSVAAVTFGYSDWTDDSDYAVAGTDVVAEILDLS